MKSSEHKTEQNNEYKTVKQETKVKKNKNATLRKSQSALSCENLNPVQKHSQDKDQHVTGTNNSASEGNGKRLSANETDGNAGGENSTSGVIEGEHFIAELKDSISEDKEGYDSALGTSTYSSLSYESLLSVDDLHLYDIGETLPKVSTESKGSERWSPPSTSSKPTFFCTPKLPITSPVFKTSRVSRTVFDIRNKDKINCDKVQLIPVKPELKPFQKQTPDHGGSEQAEIDGERSQLRIAASAAAAAANDVRVHSELDEDPESCYSLTVPSISSKSSLSSASSLSSCTKASKGGMSDFVILHADDDQEDACCFMEHLLNDIDIIPKITVDLLSNIDAGKPGMQSLETLHDNYRYILTFVTMNLESNKYVRFLNEIILTLGLREANGKEDRVVPVLTKMGYCKVIELSILGGLRYFNFQSDKTFMKESYIKCVKNLAKTGRKKFP